MIPRLCLRSKFIFILVTVFFIGSTASWYLIQELEHEEVKEEAVYNANLLLESMVAVRNYTSEHVNRYLKPLQESAQNSSEFIRESAPSFAANKVFEILKRNNPKYVDFEYKEAAINPTNRKDNLADLFEQALIHQFRTTGADELSGPRLRYGEEFYFSARPIKAQKSCLYCHSTPDVAPNTMLTTFGRENGFGWQEGEVVAARMVYVPMNRILASGFERTLTMIAMLIPVFITLAIAILIFMNRTVITPLSRLSDATKMLTGVAGKQGAATLQQVKEDLQPFEHRHDELSALTHEFLSMAEQIKSREAKMEAYNQALVESKSELMKRKTYLSAILDGALEGIITVDSRGIIQTCNPAALTIFGYEEAEMQGSPIVNIMTPDIAKTHDNAIARYIHTGVANVIGSPKEWLALRKDRSEFWVELSITPIEVDGEKLFVGMVKDIDARKRAEAKENEALIEKTKIEAKSEAKSSFLAHMSHEIRTPLGAIIGYAESLLDSEGGMEQRVSSINTIIRNGHHLLSIINDILDLSKIESSNFDVCRERISVFEVINEVKRLVEIQAQEKGLIFDVEYQLPLPEYIESDPLRMKQILINLCNNAVKFTQEGEVIISVFHQAEAQRLCIDVCDTGIGLTDLQQQSVFDEYVQADYLTTRKYGGTGLGLPISKKLASKLGGDISVMSETGKGSRFGLRLPTASLSALEMTNEVPLPQDDEECATERARLAGIKLRGHVLVAEDMPDNQGLISYYLTKLGLECALVENGEEAVEAGLAGDFDLILMDMQMPVKNGISAVETLRAAGCSTPIIMLTGNAMEKDKKDSMDAGCNGYLSKPIDRSLFVKTMMEYLDTVDEEEVKNSASNVIYSSLWGVEEKDMNGLIEHYVTTLPERVEEVMEAMERLDWKALALQFHQYKSGGSFGYPQLTALAKKAEFQVYRKDEAQVRQLVRELQFTCEQIVAAFKAS